MNRFEKEFLLKYNYGDGAKTVDEILKNFKINENVAKRKA